MLAGKYFAKYANFSSFWHRRHAFFTQILQISIENSALFVHKYFIFGMLNSTTKHTETGHVNEEKKSGKYVEQQYKGLAGTDIVERINEKILPKTLCKICKIFAWLSLIFGAF